MASRQVEICLAKIKKLDSVDALKEIPESELREILEDLNTVRESMGLDALVSEGKKLREELEKSAKAVKRAKAIGLMRRKEIAQRLAQPEFKDAIPEGFASTLRDTSRISKGGRRSVDSYTKSYGRNYTGKLYAGLEAIDEKMMIEGKMVNAKDAYLSGQIDKELYIEGKQFEEGGRPGITGNKIAQEIAKVMHGINLKIVKDARANGVDMGYIANYVVQQVHDRQRMRTVGATPEASKEMWKKDIFNALDHKVTFKGMTDAEIDARIDEIWEHIMGGSLADSTKHRSLTFTGQGAYEYNLKYGRKTVAGAMDAGILNAARLNGLTKIFGPNPRVEYQRALTHAQKMSGLTPDAFDRGTARVGERISNVWAEVTGDINKGEVNYLNKAGATIRTGESIANLSAATLAAAPDFYASALSIHSTTGKPFFSSLGRSVSNYMDTIMDPKRRRELAVRLGTYVDHDRSGIMQRLGAEEGWDEKAPGFMVKAAHIFFKLTGLTQHTEISTFNNARTNSEFFAELREQTFDQLDAMSKNSLESVGITSQGWDVLRQAGVGKVESRHGGSLELIDPSMIENMDTDTFKKFYGDIPKGVSAAKLQQDLALDYSTLLNSKMDRSLLQSNASTRAITSQGTAANTVTGQIWRFGSQFKSVPITLMTTITESILHANPGSGVNSVKGMVSNRSTAASLGHAIVGLTALGYISYGLKELAKGHTWPEWDNPKTVKEAFIRGGAGSLYADFLLSDYYKNYRSLGNDLLGPFIGGTVSDTLKLSSEAINSRLGDEDAEGPTYADFLRIIRHKSPGVWWAQPGIDHYIWDALQQKADPEWMNKKRARLMQDGQDFMFGL